ncbi:hypothetical protein F4821DRAFT_233266, partial [Hypoxylon rubiginosum]
MATHSPNREILVILEGLVCLDAYTCTYALTHFDKHPILPRRQPVLGGSLTEQYYGVVTDADLSSSVCSGPVNKSQDR